RSSPDRERPMVRLKRSTAGLNICAGLLWGSVTSPTTSPGVCSSPVASDRFYTLNYDEPENAVHASRRVHRTRWFKAGHIGGKEHLSTGARRLERGWLLPKH